MKDKRWYYLLLQLCFRIKIDSQNQRKQWCITPAFFFFFLIPQHLDILFRIYKISPFCPFGRLKYQCDLLCKVSLPTNWTVQIFEAKIQREGDLIKSLISQIESLNQLMLSKCFGGSCASAKGHFSNKTNHSNSVMWIDVPDQGLLMFQITLILCIKTNQCF